MAGGLRQVGVTLREQGRRHWHRDDFGERHSGSSLRMHHPGFQVNSWVKTWLFEGRVGATTLPHKNFGNGSTDGVAPSY